jgi:hypothetical protein
MNNLKLARRIQKEEIKEIINTNKKCMSIRTSFKKNHQMLEMQVVPIRKITEMEQVEIKYLMLLFY